MRERDEHERKGEKKKYRTRGERRRIREESIRLGEKIEDWRRRGGGGKRGRKGPQLMMIYTWLQYTQLSYGTGKLLFSGENDISNWVR